MAIEIGQFLMTKPEYLDWGMSQYVRVERQITSDGSLFTCSVWRMQEDRFVFFFAEDRHGGRYQIATSNLKRYYVETTEEEAAARAKLHMEQRHEIYRKSCPDVKPIRFRDEAKIS